MLEFARTIKPETLAAIPRKPQIRDEYHTILSERVTLAEKAYKAIEQPQRGDLTRIAVEYNVTPGGLYSRMHSRAKFNKRQS